MRAQPIRDSPGAASGAVSGGLIRRVHSARADGPDRRAGTRRPRCPRRTPYDCRSPATTSVRVGASFGAPLTPTSGSGTRPSEHPEFTGPAGWGPFSTPLAPSADTSLLARTALDRARAWPRVRVGATLDALNSYPRQRLMGEGIASSEVGIAVTSSGEGVVSSRSVDKVGRGRWRVI
jgi:hypothetical protein